MSLQRCQEETTSTQFLDWMEYLEQDVNAFHREDYFLANIARLLQMAIAKNPEKVKLKHFLFEFVNKRIKKKEKPLTKKKAAERMKSQFLAWAGIKRKK